MLATSEAHYTSEAASQPPGLARGAFIEHKRMRNMKLRVGVNLPEVLLNCQALVRSPRYPTRARVADVREQLWGQSLPSLPLAHCTCKSC